MAWLPPGAHDRHVSGRAAAAGIIAPPLSAYAIEAPVRPGLMLGYAALPARQTREGVRKLALVLNSMHPILETTR
jgi:GntR family transcriptional regulator/MocR family aminotransferase